jgi:hypothetical protein
MVSEGKKTYAASFGIGASVNSFFPLINVVDSWTETDSAGIHRKSDPGAGAFTTYHDRRGIAETDIPAG